MCRWAFGAVALPDLCKAGAAMGLAAIDLLQPADWERVRDFGLVCSMGYPADRKDFIALGFNDPAHHAQLLGELETAIPLAARRGVPNVITMFGNRGAAADAEAITNCVTGLNRIKALAEEQGVTVCVELLNSKVDHAGYQGDRTALDDRQELNWRGIAGAVADLGFAGYVAHEFVPTGEPLAALRQAVNVCTV